jgi:predicted outer membrane repeat protein
LEIDNTSGDPTQTVDIVGPGAGDLTIDAHGDSRVLEIDADSTATISGVTLTGGSAEYAGCISNFGNLTVSSSVITGNTSTAYGVIYNNSDATLELDNVTFEGNSGASDIFNEGDLSIEASTLSGNTGAGCVINYDFATISDSTISYNYSDNSGGAIFNAWDLTISNSTISHNSSAFNGGAIYNEGSLNISDSTFYTNSAGDSGGGIFNSDSTTITNSTLTGNDCAEYGGAIVNYDSSLTVIDCTISGNSADSGGGIYGQGYSYDSLIAEQTRAAQLARGSGAMQFSRDDLEEDTEDGIVLSGTIVAGNTGADLAGTGFSGSYDLVSDESDGLSGTDNMFGADPDLGSLAYNGGPTETMALASDSPAIDAGSSFDVNTDQRGFARIGGFNIGAYQSTFQVFNDTFLPVGTTTGTYDFNGIGVPQMVVAGNYDFVPLLSDSGPSEYAAQGLAEEAAAGNGYLCFDVESPQMTPIPETFIRI